MHSRFRSSRNYQISGVDAELYRPILEIALARFHRRERAVDDGNSAFEN